MEIWYQHILLLLGMVSILHFQPISTNDKGEFIELEDDTKQDPTKFKVVVAPAEAPRYLLYDVNPGEGFNLRRDVYMRIAVLVKNLNKISPWILVLPPWGPLYHWKSRDIGWQTKLPWSSFFDLPSLRRFVPVMEFEEFLKVHPDQVIDNVFYLQHYKEGWDKWEEKMDERPCITNPYYYNKEISLWEGHFFTYEDEVRAKRVTCISVMGHASYLIPFLNNNATGSSIMLDRAEVVLHDRYGDAIFWQARRSMRFAQHLRDIADNFRQKYLDSNDENDKTVLEEDWTTMKRKPGDALGGPYIGVHLRRADFVQSRKEFVPTLKYAAKQLKGLAEKLKLKKFYIATDAPKKEFETLKEHLEDYEVYRYEPSLEKKEKIKDGGVAIVDQWICAHARYFTGTKESTFSFRIQDEREILGFKREMTFNRLCREGDKECEQPSQWKIEY